MSQRRSTRGMAGGFYPPPAGFGRRGRADSVAGGSAPDHLADGSVARRRGGDGVPQLVAGPREGALLLGPLPIRVRRMLDLEGDHAARFVDRVPPEVGVGSFDRGFVLLGGPPALVVGREPGTSRAEDLQGVPP